MELGCHNVIELAETELPIETYPWMPLTPKNGEYVKRNELDRHL